MQLHGRARFTGFAAGVAASAFGLYREEGFARAVFMTVLWGRMASGVGADSPGGPAAYSFAPQDASIRSTNEWDRLRWRGVPLSPCATKVLGDIFAGTELDVTKLRIRIGIPSTILEFADFTPGAVTIGNTIYIASERLDRFDVSTNDGMARLAHESWHALQAIRVGGPNAFIALYLDEALNQRLKGKDPYWNNYYEVSPDYGAYPAEGDVKKYLAGRYPSKRPCDEEGLSPKIQTRR